MGFDEAAEFTWLIKVGVMVVGDAKEGNGAEGGNTFMGIGGIPPNGF